MAVGVDALGFEMRVELQDLLERCRGSLGIADHLLHLPEVEEGGHAAVDCAHHGAALIHSDSGALKVSRWGDGPG